MRHVPTSVLSSPARSVLDAEVDAAFALHRNPGAYALLLGAGVSTEARIPAAGDVQRALVQQAAAAVGADPADPLRWWRETTGAEVRYDDLLERIAPTPAERHAVLRAFFEPTPDERADGDKLPSDAHRAIARLVAAGRIRIVLTLNFDHLVEQALQDEGVTPTVVSTPAEMAALLPLHAQTALVVHLHGDYVDPSSMRNTGTELAAYPEPVVDLVSRIAREYGLLIAGWSATWDPALRRLLAANPNRFYTSWWIDPFPLSEPAERLRVLRGTELVEDSAGAALTRLADAVESIEATHARHRRLPALAVAAAKRALRGGGRAITLHDDLVAEFERLAADEPGPRRPLHDELARIEERTRVLLPLVATTAYWGTPETDGWWRPEIGRFAEDPAGGAAIATLLLTAGGVATVAARRFAVTHDLLAGLTVPASSGYIGAAEALAPQRTLPFHGSARWLERVLHDAVAEVAGIGERAWRDAWDLFAYLQTLEHALGRIPPAVLDDLAPAVERAWDQGAAASITFASASRAERDLRRAIADRVPLDVPVPHIRGGGYGGRRYPRVSAALRRELRLQRDAHPLVGSGFAGGDGRRLCTAIAIVDARIAAAASPRPGDVEGWLD